MIKVTAKEGGVVFAVRVQPRASRNGVAGELDGALKIRLAAAPVDGEANEELIRYLAGLFNLSRGKVFIRAGETAKNKLIFLDGISVDEAEKVLRTALAA